MAQTQKKFIIVGNWKLNPATGEEAKTLFGAIFKKAQNLARVLVIILPPAPFINILSGKKSDSVLLGAQDVSVETSGSFTGLISASQVASVGAQYALIGHSERRKMGDTDSIVSQKVLQAFTAGMKVIVCIGEKERDEHAHYLRAIREQLVSIFNAISDKKYMKNLVIAYEPIWAIGASYDRAPKPSDVHEMVLYIKKVAIEVLGKEFGLKIKILYGGSVNAENAGTIIREGAVNGLLVGRQSLDAKEFLKIIDHAEHV